MPREKDTYLNREGLEYYHEKVKQEFATKQEVAQGLSRKQDNLTSANAGDGISITRDQSGKVTISNTNVSAEWGNIQGNITDQTDLIDYIDQNGSKIDKIKVNGTEQQIVNKTVDISVPTKTSDLTNNSNFVSDPNYVHTDNNFTTSLKTLLESTALGSIVAIPFDENNRPIIIFVKDIAYFKFTLPEYIDWQGGNISHFLSGDEFVSYQETHHIRCSVSKALPVIHDVLDFAYYENDDGMSPTFRATTYTYAKLISTQGYYLKVSLTEDYEYLTEAKGYIGKIAVSSFSNDAHYINGDYYSGSNGIVITKLSNSATIGLANDLVLDCGTSTINV